MDSSNDVVVKKKTLGRRKIPMEFIRKKSSRQVTFSKRRKGLFKKAAELSVLCGAQITILVRSPADKLFAFGDPEALIAHLQSSGDVQEYSSSSGHEDQQLHIQESSSIKFEGMSLQEYDEYAELLENLKAGF